MWTGKRCVTRYSAPLANASFGGFFWRRSGPKLDVEQRKLLEQSVRVTVYFWKPLELFQHVLKEEPSNG